MNDVAARLRAIATIQTPGRRVHEQAPAQVGRPIQFTDAERAERHRAASREYVSTKRAKKRIGRGGR
jgi:hypothetical protein